MEQWVQEGLSRILNFDVPDDLIQYIKSIDNERDLNEYMKTLLDFDNNQHKNFFLELSKRKFANKGSSLPKQQKKKIAKNKQQQQTLSCETEAPHVEAANDSEAHTKKKTKYVNLYSQEGKNAQVVLLKGRHRCECQASRHELVNNCLRCGRVVCAQEGSGPCLFCDTLVCTPQEQRELQAETRAGSRLRHALLERRPERALQHRDRLLEYDRTSERRTKVTDDDCDYFSANSVWLSAREREGLEQCRRARHERRHASRLTRTVTFDFAGRQVVEDNAVDEVDEDRIRELTASARPPAGSDAPGPLAGRDAAGLGAPLLQFSPSAASEASGAPAPRRDSPTRRARVQDAQLQEMSDAGRCLSLHQPWASLLVDGIKMHEGRSWYTSHRGRLWIASTAKAPDPELVRAVEQQYRALHPDKSIKFPTFYPTGCLLGCVSVDECLPQEEYRSRYGDACESDSPYVWVCSGPASLRLRFPVRGQQKIYALDRTIHFAAQKSILTMSKTQAQQANAA